MNVPNDGKNSRWVNLRLATVLLFTVHQILMCSATLICCHRCLLSAIFVWGDRTLTGEACFFVMSYCNTICMNLFFQELSTQFLDDILLLCCAGAT